MRIRLQSLRFKVTAGVVVILVAAMGAVFTLQYRWLRHQMFERLGLATTPLSDVIKGTLKHAMQTQNHAEVQAILQNVSRQPGVLRVFVVDKRGEIRFASVPGEIGSRIPRTDATCQVCHSVQSDRRRTTVIFTTAGGERVYRNVNPIPNERGCIGCHDARDALNGVLISDFSLAAVDRELSGAVRGMLLALLVAGAVAALGIALSMNRLVIGRLERLVQATRLLGKGKLDLEVAEGARDELGTLAQAFNQMVDGLRRARELRERKELLESVLDHVADAVVVFGPDGAILALNRGSERAFAVSAGEVLGTPAPLLGDAQAGLLAQARAGGPLMLQTRLGSRDGRFFPARLHVVPLASERGEPLGCVAVAQDLTEENVRQHLQAQLTQSDKLAAIGRLAAGVAHELNNPLGNVLLHAKLLQEDLPAGDPGAAAASRIVDNTLRCKGIVKSLLDYAKQSELEMAWTDLNEVAARAVGLLTPQLRLHAVRCQQQLAPDLPRVRCDARQVEQVLVNLLQNGIEASDSAGGTVTVSTRRAEEGERVLVLVAVQDDGPGLAPDALSRVFEPFYTTKPQGTGLGLSICYGIVERHHGRIWAESRGDDRGRGSTFFVELPVTGFREAS